MIRVVVAGIGARLGVGGPSGDSLDAMATALRDGGTEVVYMGWDQTLRHVVQAAFQEDVDAIGLCGVGEETLGKFGRVLGELGAHDIAVFTDTPGWLHGHR